MNKTVGAQLVDENSYFRLFPEVIYSKASVDGVLYDLVQRKIYELGSNSNGILKAVEDNLSLEETAERVGSSVVEVASVLSRFEELAVGCFMDSPCYVEKIRPVDPLSEITMFRSAPQFEQLHIALTNKCSQKCFFCNPGLPHRRLQPCLGCWRGVGGEEQTLGVGLIEKALNESSLMDCQSLVLNVGDANSIIDLLSDTFAMASEKGYSSIELITGTAFSSKLIDMILTFKIAPTFQIYSSVEAHHDQICGSKWSFRGLQENAQALEAEALPYRFTYLFTGVDSQPADIVAELREMGPAAIHFDRIISNETPNTGFLYGEKALIPPDISKYILKTSRSCLNGKMAINCDGNYYPCPILLGYGMGNIATTTVQEIFRQEKIVSYWKRNPVQDTTCARCEFRLACDICTVVSSCFPHKRMICGYNTSGWEISG